jgi:GMP synthase-like glutamine amidotransferase
VTSTDTPLLILQHSATDTPGAYEDELLARGLPFERILLHEGQAIPDWRGFAGIVAMGGAMSALDDDAHPWLTPEKLAIRQAVEAGTPYWGACLGAQLLASALGARVYRGGAGLELGVLPVTLTAAARADPVFRDAADGELRMLQWHGDTYDLPDGATHLASSAAYPHQAFAIGRAYGVQFHAEATSELVRTWVAQPGTAEELQRVWGPDAVERMLDEVDRAVPISVPLARRLFGAWIDRVVAA